MAHLGYEVTMKELNKFARQFVWIAQFGFSLITPLLLCLLISYLLDSKCGLGTWIYIPGFVFGLLSSGMTAYNFYKSVINKTKREEENTKHKVSFNSHH